MGCAGSTLDDLPAVAFCRARSQCIDDAIRLRHALADAHADYLRALRSVGDSLHQLVGGPGLPYAPISPVLPLPSQRKGDPMPHLSPPASPPRAAAPAASIAAPAATVHHTSRSHSGSHLQFNTDTDEDEDDDDGPLHSGHSSPLHQFPTGIDYTEDGPRTYFHYAKKGAAAAAVSYEKPAPMPEVIQVGESSSYDGYSYPGPEANYFSNSYPNTYPLPYAAYGEMSGFFGRSSPPPALATPPPSISSSTSKAPPPPPSPPSTASWDFLNPFEAYDNYYSSYTPNRSYNVVSEEEGIPDLENEEGEVIKEVYGQKVVSTTSSDVNFDKYSPSKAPVVDEDERRSIGEQLRHQVDTTGSEGDGPEPEYDSKTVEKTVGADEVQARQTKAVQQSRVASEVVQEIAALFHKASESCDMASRMLEVGKLRYRRKNYQVMSSKMRNVVVPPISRSGVPSAETEEFMVFEEEKAMMSGNLSSTLKKLNMWEKKLCDEVKIEEKMRVLYERKSKRLNYLDERGAEADKIASTQASVKKLENKIRVAIQVISTISGKISTIRDEELCPQINELIQGFSKMWRAVVECHSNQCHAIEESRSWDTIVTGGRLSDVHREAVKQLELSLLRWIETFCSWSNAQKSFVKGLNGWFLHCTIVEQEETPDGIVPFSPGRLGAPTVFILCNQWSQEMDSIYDREVVAALQAFAASVLHIWDQQSLAERQRMIANKDMDRLLKTQEREEQTIHRAVDSLNKKLALVSDSNGVPVYGQIVSQNKPNNLQESLQQVFVAMERYADASLKMYEGLLVRTAEVNVS